MYAEWARRKAIGSQGTAPVCELAIYLCGEGSPQALQLTAENFFKYHKVLADVKDKGGTHIGKGGTAPYYYFFTHFYAALLMQHLPEESRGTMTQKLHDLFLKDQKPDGSFTDWSMAKTNDVYGTALGGVTLYALGTTLPAKEDLDGKD